MNLSSTTRRCAECHQPMKPNVREDAIYCSDACRKKVQRRREKEQLARTPVSPPPVTARLEPAPPATPAITPPEPKVYPRDFTPEQRARFDALVASFPVDGSIPPFLRRT